MPRARINKVPKKQKVEMIGDFYDVVTNLQTKKEVIGFMMGLLSPSETLMLSRRIQIAMMLLDDKTYFEISEELGVGDSTIASVARWLFDDSVQFRKHIKKHKEQKQTTKKSQKYYRNILNPYGQLKIIKELLDR